MKGGKEKPQTGPERVYEVGGRTEEEQTEPRREGGVLTRWVSQEVPEA